ncbi:hypothetical protein ACOI1H_13395 [Loktanella sp. DJP18]|uniref:hypothetical protein n=1 Tax=Loktanella sp. DJP18 TaxID=3409788 RepID=UPI003BB7E4CD
MNAVAQANAPIDLMSPEIEAILDEALEKAVALNLEGSHFVLLSENSWQTVLTASLSRNDDVSHKRITREGKPDVIAISKKTFDNLAEIVDFWRT